MLLPDWFSTVSRITQERFDAGTSNLVYRLNMETSGNLFKMVKIGTGSDVICSVKLNILEHNGRIDFIFII